VQVGQNHFEFLVDSGATVSAINKTGILQESNQTLKTVGIAGIAMSETISKPVPTIVSHVPLEQKFLISPSSPVNLMGRDMLCKLNAVIFCTPDGLFMRIPDDKLIQASQLLTHTEVTTAYLWRLLGKPSVEICNATLPCIRQYRLSPEALDGIQPVITSLLSQGILKETTSPCNTPILPLPKPGRTDEWRFVQDLRAVNNCVVPITPIVPDTHTILSSIPSDSTHYTVIDLCSAFFSIPVHPDSQYLFAFTYKRKQYTWTRMPQGYTESPTIYAAAVNRDLADLHLLGNSTLIQYADDLLLASPSKDVCIKDTLPLLTHLANKGHSENLLLFTPTLGMLSA
uniref:ribonuclease H n=1 Tax=Gadus morhua TaxID=8049 RepID=A0A8C5FFP4_GADMO